MRQILSVIMALNMVRGGTGFSHQQLTFDPNNRIEAHISSSFYNRLSIEGEGISQVFGNGDIVIEQDEIIGQVFIKPLHEHYKKPIYISVVSEKGVTQDLTLLPDQKDPQTLILKKDRGNAYAGKKSPTNSYEKHIKQAIQAVLEGRILEGFVEVNQETKRPMPGVEIISTKLYQGMNLNLEVYEVKNDGHEIITLSEATIDTSGIRALFVTNTTLKPSEKAHIIILSKRNDLILLEGSHGK